MHHCICRVYFIIMYLVAVYVPVCLTCYVCRRINLILAHVVSALLRLLYGTHFLQTFVHVHFYGSFIRQLKTFYFNNAF